MKRYNFALIIILAFLLMRGSNYTYSGNMYTDNENILSRRSVEQLPVSTQTSKGSTDFVDDNISWTDYAVDDDGNGLNDRLVIDLGTVNQSAPNFVVYGVLKSSNGTMLGLSTNSTTGSGSYTPLDGNLTLSFRGSPIKAASLDGQYDLWIDIILASMSESSLNLSKMYTTSQTYDHTTFESPSATMVGFSDHGIDTDRDRLLNEIDILVSLSVIKAGEYGVTVFLEKTNVFSPDSQRFSGYWWGYLDSGSSTIEVAVLTSAFCIEKINGPYNLTLAVLSEYPPYTPFPYQQFLENAHTTADYSYSNFDPVPAYFTGNYEDRGVDSNFDGLFDQLEIIVEVNVTEDGDYAINLDLVPIVFDPNSFMVSYGSTSGYWYPGLRNVSIMIDATSFYSLRLNTSYKISNIWLYESSSSGNLDYRSSSYTTRFYNYNEFDLPGAFLRGNYWDQGIDTDFDGLFDQLEIIVEVNVTKTGDYNIYLTLKSTVTGSGVYLYGYTSGYWTSGIRNISVMVDAFSLYSRRVNTSYEVEYIQIKDFNNQIMDKKQSAYTTRFYNYDEFDLPAAFLIGNYWDLGEDIYFDGKFEQLVIIIEVNVTKSGSYKLELALRSAAFNTSTNFHKSVSGYWNKGIQNISVVCNAYELFTDFTQGAFEIYWLVIWDSNYNIIDQLYESYTTRIYNSNDFDTTFGKPTTSVSTTTKGAPGWNAPILFLSFSLILVLKRWKKKI
ncbi:MAG: hypothetical protein ACTSPV_18040 [Candidatus Hodarchaeales archaeon]